MTPEPNGGPPRTRPDDVAEDAVMAARGDAYAPKDNLRVAVAAAPEDNHRSAAMPPESLHVSKLRRRRGSKRPKLRRLGLLEYTLLLLIGVGIAITVVMAILDLS